MKNKYNRILKFFEDYIATYSEYGQDADTISIMDKFYASDLSFPFDLTIISAGGYNNSMYTVQEAAPKMGISERHLRLLLSKGEVEGKRLGRDWLVLSLDYKRKRKPKGG